MTTANMPWNQYLPAYEAAATAAGFDPWATIDAKFLKNAWCEHKTIEQVVAFAMPKAVADAKAAEGRPLRPARFSIDDWGPFDGFTRGDTWNGWACPFFTKAQAELVMASHNQQADIAAYYDAGSDSFMFPCMDGLEEPEDYRGTLIDGVTYYSIGGWSWCWDEQDEPATAAA